MPFFPRKRKSAPRRIIFGRVKGRSRPWLRTVRLFPNANRLPSLRETRCGYAPVGAGRFSEPVAENVFCGMLPGPSDLSDRLI